MDWIFDYEKVYYHLVTLHSGLAKNFFRTLAAQFKGEEKEEKEGGEQKVIFGLTRGIYFRGMMLLQDNKQIQDAHK